MSFQPQTCNGHAQDDHGAGDHAENGIAPRGVDELVHVADNHLNDETNDIRQTEDRAHRVLRLAAEDVHRRGQRGGVERGDEETGEG